LFSETPPFKILTPGPEGFPGCFGGVFPPSFWAPNRKRGPFFGGFLNGERPPQKLSLPPLKWALLVVFGGFWGVFPFLHGPFGG